MQAMGFIISKLQTPLEKNELPELVRPLTVRMEGVTAGELLFLFAYCLKVPLHPFYSTGQVSVSKKYRNC